jgi:hypothetical protein
MSFEKVTSMKNIDNTELWWLTKHITQISTNTNMHTLQTSDTNIHVALEAVRLMSSFKPQETEIRPNST